MPRNKVLEKAKVTMPSGRSAFDISQQRSLTSLCGEIDVPYIQPVVAGTKGTIRRECFTRTAQVVSPAFHSVTEHFDFFLVPIHSLWRQWENWKLNINDLQDTFSVPWDSTNMRPDLSLPSNAPRMDFRSLTTRLGWVKIGNSHNVVGVRSANDTIKLCDWLRYGLRTPISINNRVMSLFFLGAYHKCYYDHYRNTAYEANNPYAYNFDWLYDGVHNGLLAPTSDAQTVNYQQDDQVARFLFQVHRVNYRNDYVHNIYPSLNYISNVGGQPDGVNWAISSSVGGVSNAPVTNSFSVINGADPKRPALYQNLQNLQTAGQIISVQSIRALFALDKLMRASAYAPRHVRDQYKALYGVEGVEDFDMKSERIGSFQSNVAFQEVTNMAQSASADLGALGAKGIGFSGSSDKPLNFYAKYDSIIICMHYFMPRARYDSVGLHPWSIKIAREDFYIKAFENLGLRPFYAYNVDASGSYPNSVLGWTVPNFEYKILPDLNTGAFNDTFPEYTYDTATQTMSSNSNQTSELSTFVPHNTAALTSAISGANVTAEYFKVAPSDLDNLFVNTVPPDHRLSFYQFFGDVKVSVGIVAPMSVHGQPSL